MYNETYGIVLSKIVELFDQHQEFLAKQSFFEFVLDEDDWRETVREALDLIREDPTSGQNTGHPDLHKMGVMEALKLLGLWSSFINGNFERILNLNSIDFIPLEKPHPRSLSLYPSPTELLVLKTSELNRNKKLLQNLVSTESVNLYLTCDDKSKVDYEFIEKMNPQKLVLKSFRGTVELDRLVTSGLNDLQIYQEEGKLVVGDIIARKKFYRIGLTGRFEWTEALKAFILENESPGFMVDSKNPIELKCPSKLRKKHDIYSVHNVQFSGLKELSLEVQTSIGLTKCKFDNTALKLKIGEDTSLDLEKSTGIKDDRFLYRFKSYKIGLTKTEILNRKHRFTRILRVRKLLIEGQEFTEEEALHLLSLEGLEIVCCDKEQLKKLRSWGIKSKRFGKVVY